MLRPTNKTLKILNIQCILGTIENDNITRTERLASVYTF